MIDEWAVSVKPNADPTIIKKHIEKMVEVSLSALSDSCQDSRFISTLTAIHQCLSRSLLDQQVTGLDQCFIMLMLVLRLI